MMFLVYYFEGLMQGALMEIGKEFPFLFKFTPV